MLTIPNGQIAGAGTLNDKGILRNFGALNMGKFSTTDLYNQSMSYHIRGALRGINLDNSGNLTNALFSMKLFFEDDLTYFDGNIRKQEWKTILDNVTRSFTYRYDGSSRIKAGSYVGKVGENYTLSDVIYDDNGNIKKLIRNGLISSNNFGIVDNLNYTYNTNSNKILKVDDVSNVTASFADVAGNDYTYLADGSLKSDANKGVTLMEYNYLKLPSKVVQNGITTLIQYSASGKKLKETIGTQVTDYVGNTIYKNNVLYQISHDEGRIINGEYEYHIKDHLGNLRVAFRDSLGIAKITQANSYGIFGNELRGLSFESNPATKNNFKFLGRESLPEIGLVDLQKRWYDPVIGRFISVDPMPDIGGQESLSPYQYAWNNPILLSDPDGDCPNCVTGGIGAGIGAILGGGIEVVSQIYKNGSVTDWKAVGGSALQGGITGGAAGFTGGASLFLTAGVSAGANVVGGAINNSIQGKANTVQSVAIDATVGAVAGAGGKVLDKVLSKAEGIVYLRTNPKTGAEYVGQAKSATHFDARQVAHDTKLTVKHDYQIIDRAKSGTKLDVAEESAIRARGGANNKSNPNGTLENKRYQMNEERYRAAGGNVNKPN